jgi:hypothetical protein
LQYFEAEKEHPRYQDFLPYQRFVIFSMWNIMQVHLRDSFGFRRAIVERNQMPAFQWNDINVTKFVGILKDFCEMGESETANCARSI